MKKIFSKSIVIQFVIPAILSILITASVTGFMSFRAADHAVKQKLKLSDLLKIVELKAEKIDSRLRRAKESSIFLAGDPGLIEWFKSGEKDQRLGNLVKDKITFLTDEFDYSTVSAVNAKTYHYWVKDRKLLNTVSPDEPHDGWFFRFIKSGQKVEFNIDYNKELNSTFVFTNALIGTTDEPLGAAGVGIDLTQTAKEFSSLDSFEGRSWLVNKQGIIQISNEKSEIGTKADKIFPIEIMDLLTKENESTPKVLDAISGNKEMYYAIHLLKEEDWFVVYEVSTGMVTKPLITIKLITLISGLLSTIFAILIFSYISNRVAKPIKNLTHVANKIATEGNLDIAINIKQSNEIGKLAKSFQMMTKHLKELYESLEQKVKDRTRELQLTLDDVRKLKEQQDGDYFLTSLLIKPLTYKHQFQENITVNFLVDEKKKFHFKKRDHEIGGDICIVDEITLEDKSYTVYLNADAMGKSIQGAGGVIAMGVVFKSILNRTKIISGHDLVSPERWLKNSFLELQDVFESFDGSMLISLVLGLLDNNTGFNLFINAEHPNPVLYRDGVASFLEPQLNMYKVGTKGFKGGLNLNGIKMQEGDIFIIGSDGKDDIKTREGELNFDENLFLDFVKKGEGEIERIKNKIYEFYEITDDFSLLSVKFSPPAKANHPSIKEYLEISKELLKGNDWKGAEKTLLEAHKVNSKNSSVIKSLINLYRKQNNILKTAEFCEKLSILEPWSDDLLFDTSLYYYKSGNFERSIDFLERLRLRRPTSVRVLNFYTEIYIHKQNFRMALKFNNKALKYEPENEKALKMKTIIEGELEDLS